MLNDSNALRTAASLGLLVAGLSVVWLSVAPSTISLISLLVMTVLTGVLLTTAYVKTRGRDLNGKAVVPAPIPRRGPRGSGR